MRRIFTITALACLTTGCPKAPATAQVDEKTDEEGETPAQATAMGAIQAVHDSLERDCGRDLPKLEGLEHLELAEADRERADEMLEKIGRMAQSCAPDFTMPAAPADGCDPSCDWCPVKWYWCIYNGGACVGGDNKSCCKLGACGSKHHCKEVCESSCGCDVPPLPSDGGGDGGDE